MEDTFVTPLLDMQQPGLDSDPWYMALTVAAFSLRGVAHSQGVV